MHILVYLGKPTHVTVTGPRKLKYNEMGQFHCEAHPGFINPKPHFSWRVQMGQTTENINGGVDDVINPDSPHQLAGNTLYITPETAIRDYRKNSHHDLVVECLVSHNELDHNFPSYTHVVEVLCKYFLA